jgi:hypothetical protein
MDWIASKVALISSDWVAIKVLNTFMKGSQQRKARVHLAFLFMKDSLAPLPPSERLLVIPNQRPNV